MLKCTHALHFNLLSIIISCSPKGQSYALLCTNINAVVPILSGLRGYWLLHSDYHIDNMEFSRACLVCTIIVRY